MSRANEMYLLAKNFLKSSSLCMEDYRFLKDKFYQQTLYLKEREDEKEKIKNIFYNIKILKTIEKGQEKIKEIQGDKQLIEMRENLRNLILNDVQKSLKNGETLKSLEDNVETSNSQPLVAQIVQQIGGNVLKNEPKFYKEYYREARKIIDKLMVDFGKVSELQIENIINFLKDKGVSESSIIAFFKRQNLKFSSPSSSSSSVYGKIGEHIVAIASQLVEKKANEVVEKNLSFDELQNRGIITGQNREKYFYNSYRVGSNGNIEMRQRKGLIQIKADVKTDNFHFSVKNVNLQSGRDIKLQEDMTFRKILSLVELKQYRFNYENFFIQHEDDDISNYAEIKRYALKTLLYVIISKAIAGAGMSPESQSNLLVVLDRTGEDVHIIDIYDLLQRENYEEFFSFEGKPNIKTELFNGTLVLARSLIGQSELVYNVLQRRIDEDKFDVLLKQNKLSEIAQKF